MVKGWGARCCQLLLQLLLPLPRDRHQQRQAWHLQHRLMLIVLLPRDRHQQRQAWHLHHRLMVLVVPVVLLVLLVLLVLVLQASLQAAQEGI